MIALRSSRLSMKNLKRKREMMKIDPKDIMELEKNSREALESDELVFLLEKNPTLKAEVLRAFGIEKICDIRPDLISKTLKRVQERIKFLEKKETNEN
jgi:hypothetical protein